MKFCIWIIFREQTSFSTKKIINEALIQYRRAQGSLFQRRYKPNMNQYECKEPTRLEDDFFDQGFWKSSTKKSPEKIMKIFQPY